MLTKLRSSISKLATKIAKKLNRVGFTPNSLTILGFIFSVIAGYLYYKGEFILGSLVLLLIGTCDILDGALARETNSATPMGGVFDSVIDRYSDLVVFFGLFLHFYENDIEILYIATKFWIILAIVGTIMVSYVRARVEATGKVTTFEVGLMERADRYLLLAIGSALTLATDKALPYTFFLLAILTNITVVQRLIIAKKRLKVDQKLIL